MTAPVAASALRKRVVLQKPYYSRDELGGVLATWQDAATLWASVRPLRGSESKLHDKLQSRKLFEIMLRHRHDVLPSHRFRMGTRIFTVIAVEDVEEAGHSLRITAEEIA